MNTRLDRDRGAIRCFPMTAQGTLKLRVYRRRKGEAKGFTWADYRDLILAAHRELSAPLVWIWDNLNIHLAPKLAPMGLEGANHRLRDHGVMLRAIPFRRMGRVRVSHRISE